MRFQSPRSGKFVSDVASLKEDLTAALLFQSPRSGKFVSDETGQEPAVIVSSMSFQSPRSGKFVSDQKEI